MPWCFCVILLCGRGRGQLDHTRGVSGCRIVLLLLPVLLCDDVCNMPAVGWLMGRMMAAQMSCKLVFVGGVCWRGVLCLLLCWLRCMHADRTPPSILGGAREEREGGTAGM